MSKKPDHCSLQCRETEHFPYTFGIEISVNLGLVLKITSWWFNSSVVIFAECALYNNCICLQISHHVLMLIWPVAFLSSPYYGPCVKPSVSLLQPSLCAAQPDQCLAEQGSSQGGGGASPELSDGQAGHGARCAWLPVFVHAGPGSVQAIGLSSRCVHTVQFQSTQFNVGMLVSFTGLFLFNIKPLLQPSGERQLYLLSMTGRIAPTFCRWTHFLEMFILVIKKNVNFWGNLQGWKSSTDQTGTAILTLLSLDLDVKNSLLVVVSLCDYTWQRYAHLT